MIAFAGPSATILRMADTVPTTAKNPASRMPKGTWCVRLRFERRLAKSVMPRLPQYADILSLIGINVRAKEKAPRRALVEVAGLCASGKHEYGRHLANRQGPGLFRARHTSGP